MTGAGNSAIAANLVELLDTYRLELSAQWAQRILDLPEFQGTQPLEKGVLTWTERGITALIEKLLDDGDSDSDFEIFLINLLHSFQDIGLGGCSAIIGLLQLRQAALSLLWDHSEHTPVDIQQCIAPLDKITAYAAARLAEIYAAEVNKDIRQKHDRKALMLRMAEMASSTLDLHEILCAIDEVMTPIFGRVAFYFLHEGKYMDVEDPTGVSIAHPVDAFTLEPIESKAPAICYDAMTDPRTYKPTVEKFGLKSLLALPIMAKGQVVAVALVVPSLTEYKNFSQEEIEIASEIVNTAGMAVENARLHRETERLAVIEERSRIARDLHDESDQLITGTLCVVQAAQEAFRRQRTEEALNELETAKRILRQIDAQNRLIVSGLRSITLDGLGLGEALELYFQDFRERYRIACALEISGSYKSVNEEIATAAYRIVQEALTNVALHSKASSVKVRISCGSQMLKVVVEDNGIGFDVNTINVKGIVSRGICGMQERALRVGGRVEIDSDCLHGTRIIVNLPHSHIAVSEPQSECDSSSRSGLY